MGKENVFSHSEQSRGQRGHDHQWQAIKSIYHDIQTKDLDFNSLRMVSVSEELQIVQSTIDQVNTID